MSSAVEAVHEHPRQDTAEPEADTCPECDGRLREGDTETWCTSCGLVLDEHPIDHGPEWRWFEVDERKRTGPARTVVLHDRNLGSQIGYGYGLPGRQRTINRRVQGGGKSDRNRRFAFSEIARMTDSMGLPHVVRESACQLFEQAQDDGFTLGRSLEGVATAALVASARIHGEAAPFERVADKSRVDDKHIRRTYQRMLEALGVPVPPPDPATLVADVCRELDVDASIRTEAERLCRESIGEVSGRKPAGVAAAAVYLASGGFRTECTQEECADAAGVTPPTLRAAADVMEAGDGE